jgi:8-oxo-dGTP pyrophosphatase MutT (NUDIX family)
VAEPVGEQKRRRAQILQHALRNHLASSRFERIIHEVETANKQFAALPFRVEGDAINVLLITTRRKRRWSIPKGWPIEGKPHRTAEVEAFEEAGVIGEISPTEIGRFKKRKDKGKRRMTCDVRVFPLEVRKQRRQWPEQGERELIWLPANQAADLVRRPKMSRIILRLARKHALSNQRATTIDSS